jgi:hypothetical protein
MTMLRPDPTFYPSPRVAMQAPPEEHAYVVLLNPDSNGRPDALAVMRSDARHSTVISSGSLLPGKAVERKKAPTRWPGLCGEK